MKTLSLTLALLAACLVARAETPSAKNPVASADKVIWAGLDYSRVRMIGPGDFRDPEAIFPDMLDNWNALFLRERMERAGKTLGKPLVPDSAGMTERNRLATSKQIIAVGGPEDTIEKSHIKDKEIAEAVRSYKLESKDGVAVVFLVDRLVKPVQKGAVYVVFFDIKSRAVLSSTRHVSKAGGAGFRNYWFRVIKNAEVELKKRG